MVVVVVSLGSAPGGVAHIRFHVSAEVLWGLGNPSRASSFKLQLTAAGRVRQPAAWPPSAAGGRPRQRDSTERWHSRLHRQRPSATAHQAVCRPHGSALALSWRQEAAVARQVPRVTGRPCAGWLLMTDD